MRIYIETYGCSNSQAESEIMAGLLEKAGFNIVNSVSFVDAIIINSCFVKTPTEQKILFRIRELAEKYPEKKLIVAGCMPEASPEKILNIAPDVSLISTHHVTEIASVVSRAMEGERVEMIGKKKEVKLCLPRIRRNPIVGIVPIASGCNSFCAYCATHLAKGELFSYPKEMILKEIAEAVKSGCREIRLTAQDTAAYGSDSQESRTNIANLLNHIDKIQGKFFVRVGMMNPKNALPIIDNLIEAFRSDKVYKFIHIPVQSGSDLILKKMNRGYAAADFKKIVSTFRKAFPRIQIWTDIIVGFPGETEKYFSETFKLIEQIKPDYTNISQYGVREGTMAAKMKQVSSEVKKERSKAASELVRRIAAEKNKLWLNWSGEALVTERKENGWLARNFVYKPIIINTNEKLLGRFVKVKITAATQTTLIGELI